jgi:hypothetical protein
MDLRISLSNNPIVFILVTALLSLVHLFWGGEKTFAERIRPRLRLADAGRAQALSVYYKTGSDRATGASVCSTFPWLLSPS